MPDDWIEALGIHDAESGSAAAHQARDKVLEPMRRIFGGTVDITVRTMVFQGFVARAQGLHQSATQMIDADNPHAAFTLLRAYFENAAGILYAKDHPHKVDRFWDPTGHTVPIGKITNHAKARFPGLKAIYGQLSQFAHPQALGMISSMTATDDGQFIWSSVPQFKKPGDQVIAYAWVVELADATCHLLYEFAEQYGLGSFAGAKHPDPDDLVHGTGARELRRSEQRPPA